MSTDRPGILFEKSVLAKTFKIPSGTLMYQMEDHPQNKRVGQNCPKFSKVPVVVGRTGDSFQQNHGFYGTRVALSTSSGASHPRFRHLFRGYTVYTYTLGKQSAAGTPKWWFKNSSFSSRATNYLCSSHPLFYQLKLSEQPNLSKFAYCIIYLWLHGSIRAQHRTLIKIMARPVIGHVEDWYVQGYELTPPWWSATWHKHGIPVFGESSRHSQYEHPILV